MTMIYLKVGLIVSHFPPFQIRFTILFHEHRFRNEVFFCALYRMSDYDDPISVRIVCMPIRMVISDSSSRRS